MSAKEGIFSPEFAFNKIMGAPKGTFQAGYRPFPRQMDVSN
jgi:hypothetical protein